MVHYGQKMSRDLHNGHVNIERDEVLTQTKYAAWELVSSAAL